MEVVASQSMEVFKRQIKVVLRDMVSRLGSTRLMVGCDDLGGRFQPKGFYVSMILQPNFLEGDRTQRTIQLLK